VSQILAVSVLILRKNAIESPVTITASTAAPYYGAPHHASAMAIELIAGAGVVTRRRRAADEWWRLAHYSLPAKTAASQGVVVVDTALPFRIFKCPPRTILDTPPPACTRKAKVL
jgi:hypothetical protein